jgi:prepilin-type N-terminal cleavage/methylation domain-containing protein
MDIMNTSQGFTLTEVLIALFLISSTAFGLFIRQSAATRLFYSTGLRASRDRADNFFESTFIVSRHQVLSRQGIPGLDRNSA